MLTFSKEKAQSVLTEAVSFIFKIIQVILMLAATYIVYINMVSIDLIMYTKYLLQGRKNMIFR